MPPWAPQPIELGSCSDIYYVDTGMFDANRFGAVYLIDDQRPAIVDTGIGTNYERILQALQAIDIAPEDLSVIAPTHVHLDHAGGAGLLAQACPNADVYIHERGAPHLIDPSRLIAGTKDAVKGQWKHYIEPEPVPESRIVELTDGNSIDLGSRVLTAHHAPGHAPHQVVFESPSDKAVFTGDAAGIYVPELDRIEPTSPPPRFDLDGVLDDIEMIEGLDPTTLLYAHFGPARTADRLQQYRMTITDWFETVKAKRQELNDDNQLQEYFARRVDPELEAAWTAEKARAECRMDVRGICTYLDYLSQ